MWPPGGKIIHKEHAECGHLVAKLFPLGQTEIVLTGTC